MSGPPDILEWWVQIDWTTVFLDFDLPGGGKQQSVDATKLVPQQLLVPHRRPPLHSMVGFIYYLYSRKVLLWNQVKYKMEACYSELSLER